MLLRRQDDCPDLAQHGEVEYSVLSRQCLDRLPVPVRWVAPWKGAQASRARPPASARPAGSESQRSIRSARAAAPSMRKPPPCFSRLSAKSATLSVLGLAVVVNALAGCYRVTMPGLSYTTPDGWIREDPTSDHRLIQYRLRGENKEVGDARLVVYYFGEAGMGTVDATIRLWASRFRQENGQPSLDVARVEQYEINGLVVETVRVEGSYVGMTASGEPLNRPDRSLYAAVVHTDAGPYYFKVVGPTETILRWEASLNTVRDSFKPAPGPVKSDDDGSEDPVEEVMP